MKSVFIVLRDISENGGGERVCANLANEFSKDYKITIVSFFKKNLNLAYEIKNAEFIFLSNTSFQTKNKLKKFFIKSFYRHFLSLKTCFLIKKLRPEIVLCNDGSFTPLFKSKTSRYFRLWHIDAPRKSKFAFKFFDALVILSKKQLEVWQKFHKNIIVIPNFLPSFTENFSTLQNKIILSVGRLTHQKGFERLIDIFKLSLNGGGQNDYKLIIVGDGVLKEKLMQKIKDENLEQSVILKPFTSEIESEYKNASIYAMSSVFEGFGMVLVEAASFKLPLIAFDINTGPSDIIKDNESGFLIKDNDLHEYAKKLVILMNDYEKRREFGENARKIVYENFNKKVILDKWRKLFDDE